MPRESCEIDNPYCCDQPMYEYFAFAGKCDMCRKRERDAFIKERSEKRTKAKEALLDEAEASVASLKEKLREVKAAQDLGYVDELKTSNERNGPVELADQYRPPSPPINVENESYSQEATREDIEVAKRQRIGNAAMREWISVKWVAVDSRKEACNRAGSAVGIGPLKSDSIE